MTTSSISLILPLADAQRSRRTGAKATNLSKLVASRFAVPRGFVLSADAYRSHLWASGARGIASSEVDADGREAIREAILSHPMPEDVWRSVSESYERLSWQTGIPEPKVAVRASALEDGPATAFPGAYESCVNVSGLEALDAAIRRVWASLWSGKAAAYRTRYEVSSEPAMAVIVQQMVEGSHTGVACTANPVTGDPQVVSLTVHHAGNEPLQYEVDLRDMRVRALSESSPADEAMFKLVAEQSVLVEDVLGGMVEVEWVVDREGLWFVQADRLAELPDHFPVNWADEADGQTLWTRDDQQPICYLSRGLVSEDPQQKVLNGYLYTRRDAQMEPKNRREADRQRAAMLEEAAESLRQWQKHIAPTAQDSIRLLAETNLAEAGHQALLTALETVGETAQTAYASMRQAERTVLALSDALNALVADKALVWRLVAGVPDAVFERDALLQELAEQFSIAESAGKLDDEKWWRGYKRSVERFAKSYGYAFLDPGQAADPSRWRSWIEDTDLVFRMIGSISRRGSGATIVTRHCARAEGFADAESEAVAALKGGSRAELRRVVDLVRGWVALRSEAERDCALAGSLLRLVISEIARRLKEKGALSSAADVFALSIAEIAAIPIDCTDEQREELANKVAARKHEAWLERRLSAPGKLPLNDVALPKSLPNGGGMSGIGASAGTATGRARVVATIEEAAAVEPGDILVVKAASRAWTPFFAIAGGFVCEGGDDMSPEAIAARDYGIPAVMGCDGASRAIRDGQKLSIDGSAGTVSL